MTGFRNRRVRPGRQICLLPGQKLGDSIMARRIRDGAERTKVKWAMSTTVLATPFAVVLFAVSGLADTLNGALISAYQTNPQLGSQRAVVRQTDETVPQALSGYKPTVSASASVGEQYQSYVSKVTTSPTTPPSYTTVPGTYATSSVGIAACRPSLTAIRRRTGFVRPKPTRQRPGKR
jgi:hypothetical protein